MAISSVTNRVTYQGDGTSAVFAFGYRFHAQSDLAVFAFNSSLSSGKISALSLNGAGGLGYTISATANASGVYPNGGNVVFNSAPNAQTAIVIFRSSVVTNGFTIGQNGAIPSSGLNNEIDYLTLIAQRLQDQTTRSVRLPDGFFGTFDPNLPEDIKNNPSKIIMVNSAANGFVLTDPSLPGNYISNTVVITSGTSVPQSLGGSAEGKFLQSKGSSAPAWEFINFASSVLGTLPVNKGGTGTAEQFEPGHLVIAGSAGVYVESHVLSFNSSASRLVIGSSTALADLRLIGFNAVPLRANATGVVTMGSTALASEVSGTLPVSNGGLGQAALTPTSLIFASSASAIAFTVPVGSNDMPLIGVVGGIPRFQPLALNSLTAVTGTLGVGNGGTGQAAYVAGQIIVASTATQLAGVFAGVNQVTLGGGSSAPLTVLGYGSSAHVLTSNGDGSAPTWGPAPAGSLPAVTSKTANYNATTSDETILVSSSLFTINLYGASGNTGRKIVVKKTDSPLAAVTISGSNATLVIGGPAVTSTTVNIQGEELVLTCDGTGWVGRRYVPGGWNLYTPASTQGFGSITSTRFLWRRIGDAIDLQGRFVAGTVTAAEARVALPTGLTINSGLMQTNQLVGRCSAGQSNQGNSVIGQPAATYITFGRDFIGSGSSIIHPSDPILFMSNGGEVNYFASGIPILGWNP